jgi:ATP-dependent DNA helicase MPH1
MGRHHESELLLPPFSTSADCQPFVQKLVSKDVLTDRDLDIIRLKPFRMTAKRMEISRDRNSTLKWCYGSLTTIEKMARAMGHLVRFSVVCER